MSRPERQEGLGNKYITTANIWEVAAWRHGRHSSHIPALLTANGTLTFEHEEMATLLSQRFFAEERLPIPTSFPDDPPPRPPAPSLHSRKRS